MSTSIEKVIDNNVCVGCGACSVATSGITVSLGRWDAQTASVRGADGEALRAASRVCPFSPEAPTATEIAEAEFADAPFRDDRVGRYSTLWAGRMTDSDELMTSSSGGLTGWIATELMREGLVDGVIHVVAGDGPELFRYGISRTADEVKSRRKSMYYSMSFDEAIREVRGDGKRYALIGVPCFLRGAAPRGRAGGGLRRAAEVLPRPRLRPPEVAGFAESLAWQTGVAPDELEAVDFRIKSKTATGGYDFDVQAIGKHGRAETAHTDLVGGNWGHTMFQTNACNYCDDIFAETADVVLGDAWLPEYRSYWGGTNIILCRNAAIEELIRRGREDGRLDLESLGLEDLVRSQAGNFRHRRTGLAVRLADDRRSGTWTPATRTAPSYRGVSRGRIALIRFRRRVAEESMRSFAHAKESGNLDDFLTPISAMIDQYNRVEHARGFPESILRRARSLMKRVFGRQ